jgi:hypothetical protein
VTSIALVGGATLTLATGIFVTVTNEVPLLPSLVAVIVAVPILSAVITPDDETLTVVGSLELHVTVRPVKTPPIESLVTAVSCAVAVSVMVAGLG